VYSQKRRGEAMADTKEPRDREPGHEHDREHDNPDPVTGAPGSHPVGTAIGAAGGAAAGAAIGSVAGPIGTVVGTAIGAVAGGLAGKGAAEAINPTLEEEYWRRNYAGRPYVSPGAEYESYRPAYQYGWESYTRYEGRRFDEVEADLRREWEQRPERDLSWDDARHAVRDAWDRVEQTGGPGRASRDDTDKDRG
jgi:hypothetical protein